jgi:hypothetical protein
MITLLRRSCWASIICVHEHIFLYSLDHPFKGGRNIIPARAKDYDECSRRAFFGFQKNRRGIFVLLPMQRTTLMIALEERSWVPKESPGDRCVRVTPHTTYNTDDRSRRVFFGFHKRRRGIVVSVSLFMFNIQH